MPIFSFAELILCCQTNPKTLIFMEPIYKHSFLYSLSIISSVLLGVSVLGSGDVAEMCGYVAFMVILLKFFADEFLCKYLPQDPFEKYLKFLNIVYLILGLAVVVLMALRLMIKGNGTTNILLAFVAVCLLLIIAVWVVAARRRRRE